MLTSAVKFWGDYEVLQGAPPIKVVENAIFIPIAPGLSHETDTSWGVFDESGRRIDEAGYRSGKKFVNTADSIDLNNYQIESFVDETIIYGGYLNLHFGHFICGSLGRFWSFDDHRDCRILFHTMTEYPNILRSGFAQSCFDAFGINDKIALFPKTPRRIAKLIVPASSFDEQYRIYKAHRDVCLRIGEPFCRSQKSHAPVYLSKYHLTSGLSRIANEGVMEETFINRGVEIVYPETLNFSDQIGLFSENRTMLGPVGSALHTHIFAPGDGRIVGFLPVGDVNSNFVMVDGVAERRSTYLVPVGESQIDYTYPSFHVSLHVRDPRGVAAAMLSAI